VELLGVRENAFRILWKHQSEKINAIIQRVDDNIVEPVRLFIQSTDTSYGLLKTGLIVSGSDSYAPQQLLAHLQEKETDTQDLFVQLQASQAPNLQTALKNVIRSAIEGHSNQYGYSTWFAKHKRLIPMSFDLELLQKYVEQNNLRAVIVSFLNVETFDLSTLSELLSTLASWTDRIPIVALLGIATTIPLFESRLSKSIIRLLDTTCFNSEDQLYKIFCAVQCDPATQLYLGPSTISALHELTQEQSTTTSTFIRGLKYAYMTHFFANPLSVLLEGRLPEKVDIVQLCEAIRNTPSFQSHCETLLRQGKSRSETIKQLLNNDAFLLKQAQLSVLPGIDSMCRVNERIRNLVTLHQHLLPSQASSLQLHGQLLQQICSSTSLTETDTHQNLVDKLKRLKSEDMITFIFAHPDVLPRITNSTLTKLTTSISKLHAKHFVTTIHSTDQCEAPTSSFTFSPPKRTASTVAEKDYTTLIDDLLTKFSTYFFSISTSSSTSTTIASPTPTTLFMNEAFIYTSRSLSQTFTPRPRYAIERALSNPSDYLGCECCSSNSLTHTKHNLEGKIKGKAKGGRSGEERRAREATSTLYNLTNEAGREINVRDLYDTFSHMVSATTHADTSIACTVHEDAGDEKDDPEHDRDQTLAQFYTSLATLRSLGIVKSSSASASTKGMAKDVDVISRTKWKGL
jgi:origin recognition complex subunit 3